jgi:hypothetical protein
MATKATFNSSIPTDEPILIRPGVMHREDDFHGSAKHYALPPEHPERTAKGDLGFAGLPAPTHSFESGDAAPFANLHKG